jgi:hypothetical protein
MDRAESQIATAAKASESQFNSGSLWAPGSLPSRADTMLRGSCTNADSHLPGLSVTDGNRVLLVDGRDSSKPFHLGASFDTTALWYYVIP